MMDHLDFQKVCRICLTEGTMMSLFKVNMHKKMMAIASIQVWPSDGLPSQICRKCASKLHIAFQLKRMCEKSDRKLRQYQAVYQNADKKIEDSIRDDVINNVMTQPPQIQQEVQQPGAPRSFNDQTPYDHFMTVQPANPQYVLDNQLHFTTTYSIPGHMIYNTAHYSTLPQSQHQESQIVQLELPQPIQTLIEEKSVDTNVDTNKGDNKDPEEGKSCNICGKMFKNNIKLNRHIKIHTTLPKDLPHKCEVCGKGFSHRGNYRMHLRIHNNERPCKCPICNRGFRQAQDLEKHMRTHTGEKPHKCSFCPRAFATSSNLTAHTRIHTGERPYVCCVCQKAFCQSSELTKHMRTHTGEKSHICEFCHKGFNGSSALQTHRRQHTGERPYMCPHCTRSFTSSNCLSSHVKTHNKGFPLKCVQCDQMFRTLSDVKEHISNEHKVGEIIQCKKCDDRFEKVNEYLVHMRTHEDGDS